MHDLSLPSAAVRIRCLFSVAVALMLGFLAACQAPIAPGSTAGVSNGSNASSIFVTLPSVSSRAVTISTATTNSNFFQVIAYNGTNFYYSTATATGTIAINNVANGTYVVIALAGIKVGGTTANPIVVQLGGGSFASLVTVGPTSPSISINLTNILYTINANPASPTTSSPVTVTVTVDTGLWMIQPIITSGTTGSWSQTSTSMTGTTLVGAAGTSNWTASAVFPGPSTAQMVSYSLQSGTQGQLALLDAINGRSTLTTLYSLTGGATSGVFWYMPTSAAIGYSPTYDTSIAPGSVSVNFSSPSISVGLFWGAGR